MNTYTQARSALNDFIEGNISTLDFTNSLSLKRSIFNNIIKIIENNFGDKFDCTRHGEENDLFLNINLKGYKNYISIYDSFSLDEQYKKFEEKYGNISFYDDVRINGKIVPKENMGEFESYINERDHYLKEVERLKKESEFKDFEIDESESDIINAGITIYIKRLKTIINNISIEQSICVFNGLNYTLILNKF